MQTWLKKLLALFKSKPTKVTQPVSPKLFRLSKTGMDSLLHEEGFRKRKYKDTKGLWTIGVGHLITKPELASGFITLSTGEKISINATWSVGQVKRLMHDDLGRFYRAVNDLSQFITQGQFDALVSFAFNIGVGGFRRSTAAKLIKQQRHSEVPDAMLMWNKPKELIGRRTREANAYRKHTIV